MDSKKNNKAKGNQPKQVGRFCFALYLVAGNNLSLKEFFDSGELDKEATAQKFRVVQKKDNRSGNRDIKRYNLDAIISIGYRVNSIRATQFRR